MKNYIKRLEEYIQSQTQLNQNYMTAAQTLRGDRAKTLLRFSGDIRRNIKQLQLEYYLLTGDSLIAAADTPKCSFAELLRLLCTAEKECSDAFAAELSLQKEARVRNIYDKLYRSALHRRSVLITLLGGITGLGG